MDENDIIIELCDYLRQNDPGIGGEVTVRFDMVDDYLSLPSGSTAKYLEVAAKDSGLEITRRGSSRANLRRPSGLAIG